MANTHKHNVEAFETALTNLRRAIMKAKERSLLGSSYSRTQLDILALLLEQPNQTTSELAKRLVLTSGAVTQTVETLVHHGLIERFPDAKDRRVIKLMLNHAGQKLATGFLKERRKRLGLKLAQLPPEELDLLVESTERLTKFIEQDLPKELKQRTS